MSCRRQGATSFRARALHSENVPNGPVLLAPNHASFLDHFFTAAYLRRRIQFMGKSQLFGGGIGEWIFTHGGVFPVRRGAHDEEAFLSAFKILDRGGAVVMYCEGGRSRTGRIAEEAKPGIGRLGTDEGLHRPLRRNFPVSPVNPAHTPRVSQWSSASGGQRSS